MEGLSREAYIPAPPLCLWSEAGASQHIHTESVLNQHRIRGTRKNNRLVLKKSLVPLLFRIQDSIERAIRFHLS